MRYINSHLLTYLLNYLLTYINVTPDRRTDGRTNISLAYGHRLDLCLDDDNRGPTHFLVGLPWSVVWLSSVIFMHSA